APFLGGTFNDREGNAITFDFPPALEVHKDFSDLVDRRNQNKSNARSLTLTADGTLFEGSSWTWDGYLQFGHTENRQTLSGWRAARRWDMALDSVLEPQPDGSFVPVCAVNAQNAVAEGIVGEFAGAPIFGPVNYGDYVRAKWLEYITVP